MAVRAWVQQNFTGGQAIDKKVGGANSFANSQCLDFRKAPSQMSVLPTTRRDDGGIVQDLVVAEVMTPDGTIYAVGDAGYIYKVTTLGVWSVFGNLTYASAYGMNYRQDQDTIYITTPVTVSSISNVSGTPVFNNNYYQSSISTYDNSADMGYNVNSNQTGSSQTTAIKVAAATNDKRYFQVDVSPITTINLKIVAKGTGNWTVNVKDGVGTILGTCTILNANLSNNTLTGFILNNKIDVNVGPNNAQTYTVEVTSTVANGTVQSLASNDLLGCDLQVFARRLIDTKNGLHPMITFQQFECIGNGRYLSVYEPLGEAAPTNSSWQRHKLTFPSGYEVCGLAVFNEYLAIAAERNTTGNNTPQDGIIFYWDGLSDTYNYFTRIPEGSPRSLTEYENVVFYEAGGSWYGISSVAATPTKVRKLPFSESVYSSSIVATKVNPNCGAVRHGIHMLAWPSTSANALIPFGVYSWGAVDITQPNAFGYSYIISTGTQYYTSTNGLKIGCIYNFGSRMHISWYDDGVYGVDVVDSYSKPAPYAYYESLIFDAGIATKQKLASHVQAKWLDIDDGVDIVLKYSIDRGAWVYSEHFNNSTLYDGVKNFARFDIGLPAQEARFYELQVGIDIYCDITVDNPPTIVSATFVYESLDTESLV